ncbi:hypothetical protein J1N09_12425 [Aureitalea sp. L0-47]|uniref:hypothetical protein n=1 Tax=Aureitalea sp. L0-47 TaxID=2816962 RepID=UPI0022383BC2|nr:hypothetical protein [Aureitalea sp. L0-47]MCW5520651.1 hypothetical protein [Aureitalea sp. L0-47]
MQKKYTIKVLITLALALFLNGFSVHAQSCDTQLSVHKNRDARSATVNDPTRFQMEITNKSGRSQSYEIQSVAFEEPCEKIGMSNSSSRRTSDLNVSISSEGSRSNFITVPAGGTKTFLAEISVNVGSKLNVWKCVELKAVSEACSKSEARKLLKVYIPDPTEN